MARRTLVIMGMRMVGLVLVVVGVVMAGGYFALAAAHVGKFGGPADIGGVLLLLTGLGVALAGGIVVLCALIRRLPGRD